LYELGDVGAREAQTCPSRPEREEQGVRRGEAWGFSYVDRFGVNADRKWGVWTSYSINMVIARNFKEDRYPDTARQIMAVDGTWTWFGGFNAIWAMGPRVGTIGSPVDFPTWVPPPAWRHGRQRGTSVAYMDGHVSFVVPKVPKDRLQLRHPSGILDMMKSFTWLPGEPWQRTCYQYYTNNGEIKDYASRKPMLSVDGTDGGNRLPATLHEDMYVSGRTLKRGWSKLPADPAVRN